MCAMLRIALNINQWRCTNNCIKWFKDYDKNDKCFIVKYDIKDNYPFLTEKTIDETLNLTREYMLIQ